MFTFDLLYLPCPSGSGRKSALRVLLLNPLRRPVPRSVPIPQDQLHGHLLDELRYLGLSMQMFTIDLRKGTFLS